jgi:hypothetical protein
VYTVFSAGKSPNIRSYTVYIYGSGQPYTCAYYSPLYPFSTLFLKNWHMQASLQQVRPKFIHVYCTLGGYPARELCVCVCVCMGVLVLLTKPGFYEQCHCLYFFTPYLTRSKPFPYHSITTQPCPPHVRAITSLHTTSPPPLFYWSDAAYRTRA